MKKKLLSILLSLVLVFTALPLAHIHTYAEECAEDAHVFGEWTTEIAATCVDDGTQIRTCTICGFVENGVAKATGHSMTYQRRVDATCNANGYIENVCKNEGCSHTEQLVLEPDGHHEYGEGCETTESGEIIIEATEEQFGIKKAYCNSCQKDVYEAIQKVGVTTSALMCKQSPHNYKETVVTDATGTVYTVKYCTRCKDYGEVSTLNQEHSFSEWQEVHHPECESEGQKHRYCLLCGYEETEVIEALGHAWCEWENDISNCEHGGLATRSCSRCQLIENKEIAPSEHVAGEITILQEPTCTVEGYAETKCVVCNFSYSVEIPLADHTFEVANTVPSDCCNQGYQNLICKECGLEEKGELLPLDPENHSYVVKVISERSCVTPGEYLYECSKCGDTYTEYVEANGHDFTEWEIEEEPTCCTAGNKYRNCLECGEYEEVIIPSLANSEIVWTTIEKPTCISEGCKSGVCSECGKEVYVDLPADENMHCVEEWHIEQPSTCVAEGLRTGNCILCGELVSECVPVNEESHLFEDVMVRCEATCSKEGEKDVVCTLCGKQDCVAIPINENNHEWGEWCPKHPATCVEDGIDFRSCLGCGAEEEKDVAATGEHIYDRAYEEVGDCQTMGYIYFSCVICGHREIDSYTGNYGEHASLTYVLESDNCEEEVRIYEYCDACGNKVFSGYAPAKHTYDDWSIITNPQIGVKGEKTRTCTVCGHVEHLEIPALADINGDGVVTKDDYNDVLDAVNLKSTLTDDEMLVADVNGDGAVDAFDLIYIDLISKNMA